MPPLRWFSNQTRPLKTNNPDEDGVHTNTSTNAKHHHESLPLLPAKHPRPAPPPPPPGITPGGGYHPHPPLRQQQRHGGKQPQQGQQPPHAAAAPHHYPNYSHGHGYTSVNYQNYAAYPPPPSRVGGGNVGGGGHYHPPPPPHPPHPPHHPHQYHPPVAHKYTGAYPPYLVTATAPVVAHAPQKQEEQQYQYPPEPLKEGDTDVCAHDENQPSQKQNEQATTETKQIEQPQQLVTEKPPPEEQVVVPERTKAPEVQKAPPPLPLPTAAATEKKEAVKTTTTTTTTLDNGVNSDNSTMAMEPVPAVAVEPPVLPTVDQTTTQQPQQQDTTGISADETPPPASAASAETDTQEDHLQKNETQANKIPFASILSALSTYNKEHGHADIPASHPCFATVVADLVAHGIEDHADAYWEDNFRKLNEYKLNHGDCDVPFTDAILGAWAERQRRLYNETKQPQQRGEEQPRGGWLPSEEQPSDGAGGTHQHPQQQEPPPPQSNAIVARNQSRFARLAALGFSFEPPPWDTRLRELMRYQTTHCHCSPPIDYPKLGIWVINQRFNIKDMPKERVAALDSIGFVWNHNRKNRSQLKWDQKYDELLEYVKEHKHCNVPATYRHSPLGTWVGKQREEYKKLKDKKSSQLDKYRIDKLNEVNFQWSLQSWTVISWDDRFDALKKFKEKHGHCSIPRNHPDFGNWPNYQKSQYHLFKEGKKSKITKEKVDRLTQIGFLDND